MILNNLRKKGFTLIELMVVITIIMMISISLFEPYSYYQKKIKIRLATKSISQSLYDARNMAINGVSSGSNSSIGVYLDSSALNNGKIKFLSYPYTASGNTVTTTIGGDVNLIKEEILEQGIQIDQIDTSSGGLFFFNAITGSGEFFKYDSAGTKTQITNSKIQIDISYKGSISAGLNQSLFYYTKTNIVDDN